MKTYTVYEVLVDTDGDGPAADGTRIERFKCKSNADAFAAARTCYGRPATVNVAENIPKRLAQRWGVT